MILEAIVELMQASLGGNRFWLLQADIQLNRNADCWTDILKRMDQQMGQWTGGLTEGHNLL